MKFALIRGVSELKIEILAHDTTSITYKVEGVPICCYDQHSRARVGVKFYDYQVSPDPVYVLYTKLFDSIAEGKFSLEKIKSTLERLEKIRDASSFEQPYNLMSRLCSYKVHQTYDSLKGQMSRRLKFCEEEYIVGLHWLLRDKMTGTNMFVSAWYHGKYQVHPSKFMPGCDATKTCDYASADYLSNMFGCLFAGCNRWPSHAEYASFNQSCTTPELLEEQLGIKIPRSEFEIEMTDPHQFEEQ